MNVHWTWKFPHRKDSSFEKVQKGSNILKTLENLIYHVKDRLQIVDYKIVRRILVKGIKKIYLKNELLSKCKGLFNVSIMFQGYMDLG